MPVVGDNGQPKMERQKQEQLIRLTALHGGDLKPELRFMAPEADIKINIK
ncbi:MAG TPA: hypothetical protein VNX68_01430 [Nitrosopumilaceae archaeon]|jgi:hypothetical protein|nr:hypothetical protein [Nitrosopumilaceae archaeon]